MEPGPLMVELALDSKDGRIVRVETTVTLAYFSELLCSLLIGRRPSEGESALQELPPGLRGGLASPTLAALANALSGVESAGLGMNRAGRIVAAYQTPRSVA